MSISVSRTSDRFTLPARLLAHAGLAAMAVAGANAQAQAPQAAAEEASQNFADIIVTAQRREQRLQDVPVAVSAFNEATLKQSGVTRSTDLMAVTPGLTLPAAAYFIQPMIRGVGSYNTHPGDEPNVATYIDGVYISQMTAGYYNLANIERVEVLKGPQGTLFGRNATGGAINVKTKDPTQDVEGSAELSYGRFNSIDVNTYLSGGLGESAAASVTGSYNYRDGYFRNRALANKKEGQLDAYAVRAKLLVEPSDRVRLLLSADISRRDTAIGTLYHVVNRNSAAEGLGVNTSSGDYDVDQSRSPFNIIKQKGVSAEAQVEFDAFDLISVTAWRRTDQHNLSDADGTRAQIQYFDQTTRVTDFTQELRLASNADSKFQWIAGAFAYVSTARYLPLIVGTTDTAPPLFSLNTKQDTTALAGFFDGTYPLTDQLSITGGIRYSHEKREFSFVRAPALPTFPNGKQPAATFKSWTPRAVLSYKPDEDMLLYASYSKGFKSGGFATNSPTNPRYRPEKITAYELGAKTSFGRTVFNVAAFYYDYKDLQVSALAPGVGTAIVTNATSARMKGFDADLSTRVTDALTVRAGVSYNDAKYKNWQNASVLVPRTPGIPGTGNRSCVNNSATGGVNECDVSGNRVARAPKFTFNLGGAYRVDLADGYRLTASSNFYYNDGYTWEPLGRLRQPSYETLNAQLELAFPGDKLSLSVWGRNLTNERYFINLAPNGASDRGEFAEPITYGATVKYSF